MCANKLAILSSLVVEIGEGNFERITIFKNQKILNVRHAERTEMNLSMLLFTHH